MTPLARQKVQPEERGPVETVQASLGAYGLRLEGLASASDAMQPVPAGSPTLAVSSRVIGTSLAQERPSSVTARTADLRLLGGGRLRMRRGEGRAHFSLPVSPSADDLLHPFLAPAAALAQLWRGKEALHAGAFATAAGAVLLIGGKEDGKSTTLAWIAMQHGLPVIADDLAVVVDGSVLAGPRCLDVRSEAAIDPAVLGGGKPVRAQTRRRVALPAAPDALPVAAVVSLRWGSPIGLRPIPLAERLPTLITQRMFYAHLDIDSEALLDLIALPMLTLTRPRGEQGLAEGVAAMLDQLA